LKFDHTCIRSVAFVLCTEKAASGAVVPTPTLPFVLSTKSEGLAFDVVETTKSAFPIGEVEPIENTPANVEVAVVDVALIAATTGVDEDTRLPLLSVVITMFAPIPERLKFVALRFVAKKFVDVAFVVVELSAVKF
jgi:hypothetical protein